MPALLAALLSLIVDIALVVQLLGLLEADHRDFAVCAPQEYGRYSRPDECVAWKWQASQTAHQDVARASSGDRCQDCPAFGRKTLHAEKLLAKSVRVHAIPSPRSSSEVQVT